MCVSVRILSIGISRSSRGSDMESFGITTRRGDGLETRITRIIDRRKPTEFYGIGDPVSLAR
jgi:hypothetical protein